MLRDQVLSRYQHRSSVVHRWPAGAKLALTCACVVAVVAVPRGSWPVYGALGGAALALALVARLDLRRLGLTLLLLEPFVLGIALLALLRPDGARLFLDMLAKSTLCLAWMLLLTSVTRFTDLLDVLWRLRVPSLLVTTLALMHRYLFVLAEELARMQRARRSRTFLTDRATAWRGAGQVAGHLFLRASSRAERVYLAMCARGWRS